jgi:hypothetical protein
MNMDEAGIAICLLSAIMALAGPSLAMSQANSGPFTLTVDSPTIGSQSPQTIPTRDGEQFTAYEFSLGNGTVLIAEYPISLANTDMTGLVKSSYLTDPNINQEDIQVQSYEIDGQQGAIAQAYSPEKGIFVYVGVYLYDEYTTVIIISEGDVQLFDNAIKSIHVQKNGESSDSSSQTTSPSTLFSPTPGKEGSDLSNQQLSQNKISDGNQPQSNRPRGAHTELVCRNRLCYNMYTTHYDWCYRCEYEVVNG